MASLSHDIILDVLCRIGVKDLLRFRCISKSWCSSIDDPYFIKHHLSHSLKTDTNLSLIFPDHGLFSVNLDSLETTQKLEGNFDIVGSCNGLLALRIINSKENILLWNPSTGKSQMLPVTEIEISSWDFCSLIYGFGYDPISDDYKLVRIIQFYDNGNNCFDSECKVYSLRTNIWKRIKDLPFFLKRRLYGPRHRQVGYQLYDCGVLANNALHWFGSEKTKSDTIVAFNLGTEEYHIVELPGCLDKGFQMYVSVMGGRLCLIAHYLRESHVVDVWMMKEYGIKDSWTKLISLKKSKVVAFVLPLAFPKNGDKILLNIGKKKLDWYDMRSKTIDTLSMAYEGYVPNSVVMYVESLVPLSDDGAMINKKKQCGTKNERKNTTKR